MPSGYLIVLAVGICGLLFAPRAARALCNRWELVKPNFQGTQIPASLGLTFLLAACPVYVALLFANAPLFSMRQTSAFLLTTAGFGLLGLLDDKWGSRAVGGFKGHIKSLLRGKPTTGGAKLIGGGLFALVAAWLTDYATPGDLFAVLLDAALIALAANALNLLDLRPGRAFFGFAVLSFVAASATAYAVVFANANAALPATAGLLLFAPVVLAALREVGADARARGMLGDTGSNLLGATVGLACVCVLPVWGRVVLALVLLALNGLAERVSLSALINKTPVLARLDKRLGVR